jgi:hypothetical protein
MNVLHKFALALIFIPLLTIEVCAQQNFGLAGSYLFSFGSGGGKITLKTNGTFTAESGSCTGVTTASGPYSISNGVVHFRTVQLSMRSFDDNKERDLTKRKNRKKYLEIDEPFVPESWEIRIVRWGDRAYLIDEKSFDSFIDAINVGFEPRDRDGYPALYGEIYLRQGDEFKPVSGPPSLPADILKGLLAAPVVATVLQVEGSNDQSVATIDRGSANGLKRGTTLVAVSSPRFYERYYIESVTDRSATLRVFGGVKVGDQLTTRVSDPFLIGF